MYNEIINIIIWICLAVFVAFTYVIAFGAPFLPTLRARTGEALDMLNLDPGQTLLELGSGDGRILRAAAERGVYAIGYELNPLLVLWSKLHTWRYRRLISIRWGNYWRGELPPTDAIYVFLLKPYMQKLDKKIIQDYKDPVKLVSFGFTIPNKTPAAELNGLYLYLYNGERESVRAG